MGKLIGLAFGGEFEAWEADKNLAKTEQKGIRDWKGGEIPYIRAKEHVPMAPLDSSLEKFLSHLWKSASVNKATAKPQQFLAGSHRQPRYDPDPLKIVLPPYPRPAGPKLVAPTSNPLPGPMQNMAPHLNGIAKDWKGMLDLKRIVAYGFRGDGRGPDVLKQAGGFNPPSTRTDEAYLYGAVFKQFSEYIKRRLDKDITLEEYKAALSATMDAEAKKLFMEYSFWRDLCKVEEMHLGRMLANEALKGYISTTRAVTVAKGFASGGWVYCMLVRGGYLVPEKGKTEWTKIFGEQEIAYPGSISWENVIACRKVNGSAMFEGPVFIKLKFRKVDKSVASQVYELLSGKKQE